MDGLEKKGKENGWVRMDKRLNEQSSKRPANASSSSESVSSTEHHHASHYTFFFTKETSSVENDDDDVVLFWETSLKRGRERTNDNVDDNERKKILICYNKQT